MATEDSQATENLDQDDNQTSPQATKDHPSAADQVDHPPAIDPKSNKCIMYVDNG